MKRLFDLCFATAALVCLSPAFIAIGIAIKATSRGPILFRQKRLGLHAKPFTIFKFRTMRCHQVRSLEDQLTFSADPRITAVGRFLRNFRLDELPQLLNVVRGAMSVVGPRPLTPDLYSFYTETDKQRLRVLPGITGWQQVNGGSQHTWAERIALDVWYVNNATLGLDLKIILRTIPVLLSRNGVYAPDGSQLSGVPEALAKKLSETFNDEYSRNRSASR